MPQDKKRNPLPCDSSVRLPVPLHFPSNQCSQFHACQVLLCLTCWYTLRLLPSDQVCVYNCFLYILQRKPTLHNQLLPALLPPLLLLQPLHRSISVHYSWAHIHRCPVS